MNQHQFNQILEKYLRGECTPGEERFILEWQENILRTDNITISSKEKTSIKKRIWRRLSGNTLQAGRPIWKSTWFAMGVAASALLVLSSLFLLMPRSEESQPPPIIADIMPETSVEVKNTTSKAKKITLEDGSLVILKPNSRMSYPRHFGQKTRNVLLEGEAFFDVKKDHNKPFIVHTGDLVTEVLGTSFTIKSDEKANVIEVSVQTGRVSVYENSASAIETRSGVILTPNQKTTYYTDARKLTTGIVEKPAIIQPLASPQSLIFEEDRLPAVLKRIAHTYGIEVIMENRGLNECVFTGDLNGLPFLTQLDLICKSVNATSEQRGTAIFIKGEGCQLNTTNN
jgi:ferric-dicitrate binding protein FerR (iron transport regulator)